MPNDKLFGKLTFHFTSKAPSKSFQLSSGTQQDLPEQSQGHRLLRRERTDSNPLCRKQTLLGTQLLPLIIDYTEFPTSWFLHLSLYWSHLPTPGRALFLSQDRYHLEDLAGHKEPRFCEFVRQCSHDIFMMPLEGAQAYQVLWKECLAY